MQFLAQVAYELTSGQVTYIVGKYIGLKGHDPKMIHIYPPDIKQLEELSPELKKSVFAMPGAITTHNMYINMNSVRAVQDLSTNDLKLREYVEKETRKLNTEDQETG